MPTFRAKPEVNHLPVKSSCDEDLAPAINWKFRLILRLSKNFAPDSTNNPQMDADWHRLSSGSQTVAARNGFHFAGEAARSCFLLL